MTDLTFYTNPMSRGRVVRWMLEEVGEPYDTVILDYERDMKAPDYLAVNPMGKVPAIRHGDIVVTETAAICAYLADAFPDKGLAPPPGDRRRGPYFRWLFFGAGPLEQAVTGKAMGLLAPAEHKRMAGYGSFDEVVDTLDGWIGANRHVCGDMFTAADLCLSSTIGWSMRFDMLPHRSSFADYVERMQQRPACQRAAAIDDAALAERQG